MATIILNDDFAEALKVNVLPKAAQSYLTIVQVKNGDNSAPIQRVAKAIAVLSLAIDYINAPDQNAALENIKRNLAQIAFPFAEIGGVPNLDDPAYTAEDFLNLSKSALRACFFKALKERGTPDHEINRTEIDTLTNAIETEIINNPSTADPGKPRVFTYG